jgi:adenine C2-methylase RlmN of 23S rRNA A2503 and tRNA A37
MIPEEALRKERAYMDKEVKTDFIRIKRPPKNRKSQSVIYSNLIQPKKFFAIVCIEYLIKKKVIITLEHTLFMSKLKYNFAKVVHDKSYNRNYYVTYTMFSSIG